MRNQLTRNKPTLFVDQYGGKIWATTRKELVAQCGGGHVSKMYNDKKTGEVVWTGYVVGARWFTALQPVEIIQNGGR